MRFPSEYEPDDDARPFVDPKSGSVDVSRLLYEARPIAEIALLFAVLAAVVLVPVWVLFGPASLLGGLLLGLSQLIVAVGAAVAVLYVLVRAMQLAGSDDGPSPQVAGSDDRPSTQPAGSDDEPSPHPSGPDDGPATSDPVD